jgi:hypothetical protein|tara:strand:+ start:9776 stop:9991 length:216 start_codon:yes stop_codon:yes gene_type:complete
MDKPIAIYKGYELYCNFYEDDGFFKKDYWMEPVGYTAKTSIDASSYDNYEIAVDLFRKKVDNMILVDIKEE